MRAVLSIFFISILTLACQRDQPPNIILIMADDQGWGDVGYNGHPHLKTPHLDAMAQNGAVFTRFYSAGSVCSPTRASVMTGRHPSRMGICSANCGHVRTQEITLAEMVKEKATAPGILANGIWEPHQRHNWCQSWWKRKWHSLRPLGSRFWRQLCHRVQSSNLGSYDYPPQSAEDVKAPMEGGPFGTYYWTGPGHRVTQNLLGDDSGNHGSVILLLKNLLVANKHFYQHLVSRATFACIDRRKIQISLYGPQRRPTTLLRGYLCPWWTGRAFEESTQKVECRKTPWFYTSDNGPETSKEVRDKNIPHGRAQGITKGLRGRKRSLYEGGIRVPGIVEWPDKISSGTRVDVPCFTSDYFPTIAHVLGIDTQKYQRPYDGENLTLTGTKKA